MSSLSIFREEELVVEHELVGAEVALGRHPDNDIVLEDRTLSRFHARLESRGRDYVVVELPNQNGVYVNGVRVNGEHDLAPGDRIRFGCYVAIFDPPSMRQRRGAPELPFDDDIDATSELNLDFSSEDSETLSNLKDRLASPTVEKRNQSSALVLTYKGLEVSRHPTTSNLVIGRSKSSDIVISLLGLSRKHVDVRVAKEGVFVRDLGSQNGTWVNNQRIEGERKLADRDVMNFYEYALVYLEEGDDSLEDLGQGFKANLPTGTAHEPLDDDDDFALDELDDLSAELDELGADALEKKETGLRAPPPEIDEDDELGLGEGIYFEESFEPPRSVPNQAEVKNVLDDNMDFEEDSYELDQTTFSGRPKPVQGEGANNWLQVDEEANALALGQREGIASVEVFLDDTSYTQFILSNPVTRIGSDPRCELSLPPESGVAPWHCTLATIGLATMCYRHSSAPYIERNGVQIHSTILEDGDDLVLGRIRIVLKMR